jgi:hypothetical protein
VRQESDGWALPAEAATVTVARTRRAEHLGQPPTAMTEREHPAVVAHRRHRRVRVVREPCRCDGERLCGFYFSQLGPAERRAAQVAAGVRPPAGR